MLDTENKLAWCAEGEKAEQRFAGRLLGGNVSVFNNPAKVTDKFTHDLFIILPSDLKTIRTRFNTADRYGIDPRTAITINVKDLERYKQFYPHIVIIFDIDFGDFQSVRITNLREIKRAIKLGMAKPHTYLKRVDDTQGNGKESYVLDALWFSEIGDGK